MNELYQQRLQRHLRQMLHYLRLVFNDHFVIALMFFVGGLGLAYSSWLKTVTTHDTWIIVVVGVALWLGLRVSRIATLLESADTVFLLPREHDLHTYFQRAWRYSWLLAIPVQVIWVGLVSPLLMLVDQFSGLSLLALLITQLALKDSDLTLRVTKLYRLSPQQHRTAASVNLMGAAVITALALAVNPWLGAVLALALAGGQRWWHGQIWTHTVVAWKANVASEANRMLGIYRFFNLFTDVPLVQGNVKRRKYLDGLLRLMPADRAHAFGYLFTRGMLRGTEFSGLVARLTIIGAVLLYFVGHGWLAIALDVIFIYLIGFQLLPFYKRYDNIVFTHIYPLAAPLKLKNFQRLLTLILGTTGVIFLIAFWLTNASLAQVGLLLVINVIEIYLLVAWYAKLRLG
ncbi:ABC transporter permease [Lactiplantibacillus mudanjiangensis]|uniref:ABC transporter permease [Lactobacillus sp.] n=1 Tax=Lactiplantibacillus mudanjiangensis TaxID=1296538 RepID=A0A660E2Y9_9LACO|nr:ABC transporter permease [Lactiplantibacillus mudanjiangensis]VDG18361.1 ABC transporter permease [Lactobacillus sp.] [Lactiplantibacillus mudanjiangensis]VDG23768.1 ABC transporter permease [Lactobacillus sp.] [Lactiplantibacillus mudanjiangensis]VDG29706.1 ABC transporter permease [Lactobacillus sp.] [Lactiplantibacillus mudanjiangensis]